MIMGPRRTGKIDQGERTEPSISMRCSNKALAPKKSRPRGSKYMAGGSCFQRYKYSNFPKVDQAGVESNAAGLKDSGAAGLEPVNAADRETRRESATEVGSH